MILLGIRNLKMDQVSSTVNLFCIGFGNIYCTIIFNIAQRQNMNFKKKTILWGFPLFESMLTVLSQVQNIIDKKQSMHNTPSKCNVLM